MYIYINGKFYLQKHAKVSVFDRGYLYGDGVFETLRAYSGVVFKIEEHLTRLFQNAKAIALNINGDKIFFKNAIYKTLKKNKLKDAYIRLSISRGKGAIGLDPDLCKKPTVVIIAKKIKSYKKEFYNNGVEIITINTRKALTGLSPRIKSSNFLLGILGKIEVKKGNYFEGIFLNQQGYITEGTISNIFIVKDKKIFTPSFSCGILCGITRNVVIELAKFYQLNIKEDLLSLYDVYNADEVFLTNTSMEIIPVVNVDGRVIGEGRVGEITKFLMKKFKEKILVEINEYYKRRN